MGLTLCGKRKRDLKSVVVVVIGKLVFLFFMSVEMSGTQSPKDKLNHWTFLSTRNKRQFLFNVQVKVNALNKLTGETNKESLLPNLCIDFCCLPCSCHCSDLILMR